MTMIIVDSTSRKNRNRFDWFTKRCPIF